MSLHLATWEPSFDDPEIQKYIFEEVGEEGLELASYLNENAPITGMEILEHYEERKPSAVRKILYKLMESHVAEYEKDTDAKGWETFVWQMTLNEIKYTMMRRWQDERTGLLRQKAFELEHEFYAGKSLRRRMLFEDAMEIHFECPVTGEPMEPMDNQPIVDAMDERLAELEKILAP